MNEPLPRTLPMLPPDESRSGGADGAADRPRREPITAGVEAAGYCSAPKGAATAVASGAHPRLSGGLRSVAVPRVTERRFARER